MSDIRVVRLETKPDALVPQRYMSFVGKKYILILSDNSILQFDNEGNFIRILAKRGKGPGEFYGIFTFDVNEDESKVYIHHWGDAKRILGYHLETGTALPVISLPNRDLSTFILLEDHVLGVCGRSSNWELFTISFEGELRDTLPNLNPKSYRSYAGRGKYLKRLDGEIYYMNELSDTLYRIDGVHKSAISYFKVDNQYDFETKLNGNLLQISNQLRNKIILTVMEMHTEQTADGVSTEIKNKTRFLWEKKAEIVDNLSGFYHDYFEMEVEDFSISNRGEVIYIEYSPLEFRDLLSTAQKNKELSPKKAVRFKDLDATISEYDNPIYLISDW